jgi:hypothetical protein
MVAKNNLVAVKPEIRNTKKEHYMPRKVVMGVSASKGTIEL